jgi:hypothetical protein
MGNFQVRAGMNWPGELAGYSLFPFVFIAKPIVTGIMRANYLARKE